MNNLLLGICVNRKYLEFVICHLSLGIGHEEEAGEQGSRGQGREYKITSFSSAPFPLPLCLSLIPRLVSEVEPHLPVGERSRTTSPPTPSLLFTGLLPLTVDY